jgi:CRISPR-associated protein Cas1
MEAFRPIVADSVVVTAINTGRLQAQHFVRGHEACALTPAGRNALLEVFEHRMNTEIAGAVGEARAGRNNVTHPIFGDRATWRRTFEIQARLFARWIQGEILTWPHFKVR